MRRTAMIIVSGLMLAGCVQSPAPVMSEDELRDYRYCRGFIPEADAKSSGYPDPMATCMQWRKQGWGKGVRD